MPINTLNATTFEHVDVALDTVAHRGIIGSTLPKFIPNLNLQRWNDEAWLNINHPDVVTNEIAIELNGIISQTIGNNTHRFYEKPGQQFEYEIELASRPATNVIVLNLQFPDGLTFHYQPALTQSEIDAGAFRSPDVVGSYAVYWNKSHNTYQSGKFCHIYRPFLIDANGQTIYADIDINPIAKTLTITMDGAWLDNATYPVIVDPTIGLTTQGATVDAGYTGGITVTDLVMPEAGTLNTFYFWARRFTDATRRAIGVVYADSAGAPTTLVASTAIHSPLVGETAAITSVAISGSLSAIAYQVGVLQENTNSQLYYDTTTWDARRNYTNNWSTPPNPYSGSELTYTNRQYSIWLDYTAAGGAPTLDTIGTITPGATGIAFTYSNFGSTPNSLTLSDGTNSFAMTSVSAAGGSGTFSCPAIASIGCMFSSATYTITATLSDGTDSDGLTATFNPPSGYAVSTPTGTWLTSDASSLAYNWGSNVTTADQVIYPTNDSWAVDAADGHWTTNQTTGTSTLYAIDHTTFSVETFYVYFDSIGTAQKVSVSLGRYLTIGI